MPTSQDLARRERAIETAQRRLRWLEIETRRMKAELARLSAACDDDVAKVLSREWGRPECSNVEEPLALAALSSIQSTCELGERSGFANVSLIDQDATAGDWACDFEPPGHGESVVADSDLLGGDELWTEQTDSEQFVPDQLNSSLIGGDTSPRRYAWWDRAKLTPMACSFTLHTAFVVFLAFGVSYTVAKFEEHSMTLLTSVPTPADASLPAPLGEEDIEPTTFSGGESATPLAAGNSLSFGEDILPVMGEGEAVAAPLSLADVGRLDQLPSDLGTLLAGSETTAGGAPGGGGALTGMGGGGGRSDGKRGGGSPSGSRNATMFFGTHAKGNRFVFVIDNSSSMKDGRLDMARTELLRTIQNFSPKQSFYVIFVSDETYPMYYPQRELAMQPATAANLKRLAEWLPNAILASGKNRELIKAMDMAANLQPDAVYLLWDGDMKYSDAVRMDVMTHLTAPNQWKFTIHTLGMGATSAEAEQNLAAIAQAHGGVYRRVDVPGLRPRK